MLAYTNVDFCQSYAIKYRRTHENDILYVKEVVTHFIQ